MNERLQVWVKMIVEAIGLAEWKIVMYLWVEIIVLAVNVQKWSEDSD